MASAALLLLLMVSCSLLTCSLTDHTPATAKITKGDVGKYVKSNLDNIKNGVVPALQLIPFAGSYLAAIVNMGVSIAKLALQERSQLEVLMDEFSNLKYVLKEYRVDQKWDKWASGAYYKPELDISTAWKEYEVLMQILKKTKDQAAINRHLEQFLKSYEKYESATRTLHELLKPKDMSLSTSMGSLLPEHARCHIRVIRQYSVFIQSLIMKGNTLNLIYYQHKNLMSEVRAEEAVKIYYDAGKIMFNVEKNCISDSAKYIENDLKGLIDESKDRSQLAKEIRKFLDENYQLYDWVVFAFKTKKPAPKLFKNLNKHVFWGFTEVPKGSVSVAVAWQVKGRNSYITAVKTAVNKCLGSKALCVDVPDKLNKCAQHLVSGDVRLLQTLTAVHAFKGEGHQSVTGEDDEETPSMDPPDSKFYLEGVCKRQGPKDGKYFLVIKSNKEIEKDACKGVSCGEHGECKAVKGTFIGVCECKERYYGTKCDGSIDEDKRNLMMRDVGTQTGPNVQVLDSRRKGQVKNSKNTDVGLQTGRRQGRR